MIKELTAITPGYLKHRLEEQEECYKQEIERLKEDNKYLNKVNIELSTERNKLNNIINELEKYINEEYAYDDIGMKIFDASKLQDKLQELKGEDKTFNERVEEIYNSHMKYIYDKEDKKIEKINILNCDDYVKKENYETILTMQEITLDIQTLKNKINKIIDYINKENK